MKNGEEFQFNKQYYKITKTYDDNTFLAIWVGDEEVKDYSTYRAFVKNGDFSTDQSLFEIRIKQDATGVAYLDTSSEEYKQKIGRK